MGRRIRVVRPMKDQRMFTRTAMKVKKINLRPTNSRGGAKL